MQGLQAAPLGCPPATHGRAKRSSGHARPAVVASSVTAQRLPGWRSSARRRSGERLLPSVRSDWPQSDYSLRTIVWAHPLRRLDPDSIPITLGSRGWTGHRCRGAPALGSRGERPQIVRQCPRAVHVHDRGRPGEVSRAQRRVVSAFTASAAVVRNLHSDPAINCGLRRGRQAAKDRVWCAVSSVSLGELRRCSIGQAQSSSVGSTATTWYGGGS